MKKLSRNDILLVLVFVGAGALLVVSAWHGIKVAIIVLYVTSVAVVVTNRFLSALLDDVVETSHEGLQHWRLESEYAQRITSNYMQMLGLLYDHDPSAAELFQDRLSEALNERHPDIALVAERAAGMN